MFDLSKANGRNGSITTNSSETSGASSSNATAAAAPERTKRKAKRYGVSIFRAWCKECGICIEFCPHDVFNKTRTYGPDEVYPEIARPVDCTGCQQCVLHCPDFAMQVQQIETPPES